MGDKEVVTDYRERLFFFQFVEKWEWGGEFLRLEKKKCNS